MAKLTSAEIKERRLFLETRKSRARREKDKIFTWFKREMRGIDLVDKRVTKGESFGQFEKAFAEYKEEQRKK